MARTPKAMPVITAPDPRGIRSINGTADLTSDRKERAWTKARLRYIHRAKNGINDPYTFFHLVDELTNVAPDKQFTAASLAEHLNRERPHIAWDPITVGRVLGDLIESWEEANPGRVNQPIDSKRSWHGAAYWMTSYEPARAVLFALLQDLTTIGEDVYNTEMIGSRAERRVSPLVSCPSVTLDPRATVRLRRVANG